MAEKVKVLPKPVDWDELYPGRFIKATEFKGQKVTLRISEVRIEELVGDKGPQIKGVIGFERTEKQWALNKTNGLCLREMFGRKVQEWVGKRVTLFPSQFDGEDCIRVWGSPDIAEDKQITIALPRRRPFEMTMHRTVKGGSATAATTEQVPDTAKAIAQLRAAESIDAFDTERKSLWQLYAATNTQIPLDVEAAATERRETLEQSAEGMPA